MLFPLVAAWLDLFLSVTPDTPMAELHHVARECRKLYQAMDEAMQRMTLQELDRMAKRQEKRVS